MRVYIGPYKNWIGPYQISDKIPFISEDKRHEIGAWLAKTWVNNVCEWFYSKKERNIKIRIDKYDTWNMDNTLALIILPMLKQLKSTKHGSPLVDDEDVPEHMRHGGDDDNWVHYKWEWVLNEMIWAFEQELNDSWEEQFYHGKPEYIYTKVNPKGEYVETPNFINEDDMESDWMKMEQVNPNYWVDREGIKEYNDRINNGFRLFGKYYRGLWD
jgi:hypothetical protein